MKYRYEPKSNLEKNGVKVCAVLVENFFQTYFTGGLVRDALLNRKITDIDIATVATPEQAAALLQANGINFDDRFAKLGAVIVPAGGTDITITTFRKDSYSDSRYPRVEFSRDIKEDARRRDFTINALYLSAKTNEIFDYHKGLVDLKKRLIRFIGNPEDRIKEDPLRILRALRFALSLDFKIEKNTLKEIIKNFNLVSSLTLSRQQKEIGKLKNHKLRLLFNKLLSDKSFLDKYFISR